jgi:excisionase family DNA binding protein
VCTILENGLFTIDQSASKLGVSKNTIRKLITTGELPAYRVSERVVRIASSDLEALLSLYQGGEAGLWKSKK